MPHGDSFGWRSEASVYLRPARLLVRGERQSLRAAMHEVAVGRRCPRVQFGSIGRDLQPLDGQDVPTPLRGRLQTGVDSPARLLERSPEYARLVALRRMRWPLVPGFLYVRVLRQVREALHRPHARHRDLIPGTRSHLVRARQELELPPAVELEAVGMGDRMHGQAVEGYELGCLPGRHDRQARDAPICELGHEVSLLPQRGIRGMVVAAGRWRYLAV